MADRRRRGGDEVHELFQVDFSRGENMQVVAEGVETIDELHAVRELGVALMQGYYLARPSPPFVSIPERAPR